MKRMDVFRLKPDAILPGEPRVRILAISLLTGNITFQVMDESGAYKPGDRVILNRWDLRQSPEKD